MTIVDLLPVRYGVYSSFPTMVRYKNKIYLFYREGRRSIYQVHGFSGKVKRMVIDIDYIREVFLKRRERLEFDLQAETVFSSENELDAIVSKLEDNVFALCTRTYVSGKINRCFVSFSYEPNFNCRQEVSVKGIKLHAFYGKAFKSVYGYVFPAYGIVESLKKELSFLMVTDTNRWDVLSILPTVEGTVLNETSVVFYKGRWHAFLREDLPPYGIWWTQSDNLINWTAPVKIVDKAHAPVAKAVNGNLLVFFRYLLGKGISGIGYINLDKSMNPVILDTYYGNPFDGGYCDVDEVDNISLIVYYAGNTDSSPNIRCCFLNNLALEQVA